MKGRYEVDEVDTDDIGRFDIRASDEGVSIPVKDRKFKEPTYTYKGREEAPIVSAIKAKNWKLAESILNENPDLRHAKDAEGKTLFQIALSMEESYLTAELLLEYGVDVAKPVEKGGSPYLHSFSHEYKAQGLIPKLVKAFPKLLTLTDDKGDNLIHYLIKSGQNIELLKSLLSSEIDPAIIWQSTAAQYTPLMTLAKSQAHTICYNREDTISCMKELIRLDDSDFSFSCQKYGNDSNFLHFFDRHGIADYAPFLLTNYPEIVTKLVLSENKAGSTAADYFLHAIAETENSSPDGIYKMTESLLELVPSIPIHVAIYDNYIPGNIDLISLIISKTTTNPLITTKAQKAHMYENVQRGLNKICESLSKSTTSTDIKTKFAIAKIGAYFSKDEQLISMTDIGQFAKYCKLDITDSTLKMDSVKLDPHPISEIFIDNNKIRLKLKKDCTAAATMESIKGAPWASIFEASADGDNIRFIKASLGVGNTGFYKARNGEYAINFKSKQDKKEFIEDCSIQSKDMVKTKAEKALYFEIPSLNSKQSLSLVDSHLIRKIFIDGDKIGLEVREGHYAGVAKSSWAPSILEVPTGEENIISIKASRGVGDTGFYKARNGEYAINFESKQDKKEFIEYCVIQSKDMVKTNAERALYFEIPSLNPDHCLTLYNPVEDSIGLTGELDLHSL